MIARKHYSFHRWVLCLFILLVATAAGNSQTFARFNSATSNLEFRVSSVSKSQITGVQLFDSGGVGNSVSVALARINSIPLGGLQVSLLPTEAPKNLSVDPATLTVIYQPDATKPEKRAAVVQIFEVGAKAVTTLANDSAEGREDANVYISGQSIVEKGEGPQFNLDIKLEKYFAISDLPIRIAPFVEIRASNDDGATDQSNAGVKFVTTGNRLRYEGSAEIETDYKFRVTNFITSQELKYLIPTLRYPGTGTPKATLFPRLFVGAELGRNLKSPVDRDERGIARIFAGATLTLKVFDPIGSSTFLDLGLKKLVWENKFQQRWFIAREQAYDTEDDALILRDFGRRPRGHFSSNLHFMFNDYFGPTLKYEWGQLPPLYKKVNHRVTFGLAFALSRGPAS